MDKKIIEKRLRDQQTDFNPGEFRKLTYGRRLRRLNPITIQLLRALENSDSVRSVELSKYRDEDFILCRTDRKRRSQDLTISLNYWNQVAGQYCDQHPKDVSEGHRRLIRLTSVDDEDTTIENDLPVEHRIDLSTNDIRDVIDLI